MSTDTIAIAGRKYITVTTLSGMLNLHPRTVLLWETEHGLPVVRVGNMRLYDVEEIGGWLDRHKEKRPV
jgi:DNA-binding transcriptional MerR regulator